MIIGFAGAHGMGKTTVVEALRARNEFKHFKFKPSPSRELGAQGFTINELGTEVTQMYIMAKHYEYSRLDGDVILDRCALDGLVYTSVILEGFQDVDFKNALGTLGRKCFERYNIIFYVRPELELKDDGVRTVDPVFFNKIVDRFKYWTDAIKFYRNPVPVVELFGSVENRVEQVMHALETRGYTNNVVL